MQHKEESHQEIDFHIGSHLHEENTNSHKEECVAIIDLGSNSIRLMIVHILPNNASTIINQVKYMVRLGENSFETKMLQEAPIERTLHVLKEFKQSCIHHNVSKTLAIATAAVRNAQNGKSFVQRVLRETGIEFKIVSGLEEARLIYLGVSESLPHSFGLRAFIDIGGGSTELIVANSQNYLFLDSLKLGCVMLTNHFIPNEKGKIKEEVFKTMQNYVRQSASHAFQKIQKYALIEAVASSGTALALYGLSVKLNLPIQTNQETKSISIESLRKIVKHICGLTLEERFHLPGVSKQRAEVLVAGTAILLTLLEAFGMKKISITTSNLQNGILINYLRNNNLSQVQSKRNIRTQSIRGLAQNFHYEKQHADHISALALMLHDSAVDCGLISYNENWREYLHYAAILHDIGTSIAYSHHYMHTYYIITHYELLGFTEEEKEYIGLLTYFHQSKKPSKRNEVFQLLAPHIKDFITIYSLFLALAESMDRLHRQHIYETAFHKEEGELLLYAQQFSSSLIEEVAVRNMQKTIEKVFQQPITIHFST